MATSRISCKSMNKIQFDALRALIRRTHGDGAQPQSSSSLKHNYKAVSVKNALLCEHDAGSHVTIQGWIRSVRQHRDIVFLDINDGSSLRHLQIVAPAAAVPSAATFGSCVEVQGELVRSLSSRCQVGTATESAAAAAAVVAATAETDMPPTEQPTSDAMPQKVEVNADQLKVIGPCDYLSYPLKARKAHPPDYVRQFLHLRPRTATFGALLRMRSAATMAMHEYFQKEGFCLVQTPIITSNDCEGAGEVFSIRAADPESTKDTASRDDFFGVATYLTVSSQLHLEVVNGALSRVYSFGSTFRAENSRSRHHLSEFTMVEAEIAFTRSLDDITRHIEGLLKHTACQVLDKCSPDFKFYLDNVAPNKHLDMVEKLISKDFISMTYTEAVDILLECNEKFENKVSWGSDLHKEHERYLVQYCDDVPVFVTHYPAAIKPFYAKTDPDPRTVGAVDLLFPGVGEVCGGSLREESLEALEQKLDRLPIKGKLDWYLDLRRFGSVPHGGFGIGFERFIQTLLGIKNIKDTLPFPRSTHNCHM